ncbi:MAG: integrase [Nocardioides sp.]|nr:integrase [Nocardioides sp.]
MQLNGAASKARLLRERRRRRVRGTYGYRRIHADLAAEQTECSPGLVRQIMRCKGLVACQPRPFRITTEADAEAAAGMPGIVQGNFTADRRGVKFVGDITYIHTWQGFVYLVTVIDCYSKKVVGWSIADHMRTELVADALKNAAATTRSEPLAIWHSGSGQRLHLGRFQGPGDPPGHAIVDGTNRRVLGQQHGRIVLLSSVKRACVADRFRD